MNQIRALKSAGLNEKEAIIYLALIQEGESQTGRLCQKTNISSSHIYPLLENLMEKGLVTYKLVNNIKVFRAAEQNALAQLFEEKEKSIQREKSDLFRFMSALSRVPPNTKRLSDFKYFQGIRGIRSIYTELIQNWKSGEELCIASSPLEAFKTLDSFFMNVMHKQRIKDRVKFRIIINQDSKRYGLKRTPLPLCKVRYFNLKTKTEFGTVGPYFFLTTYGPEPYGLLIDDETFAKDYKVFFEFLWQQAKP